MNIITGMHWSGASLVCQLLRAAGADFGQDNESLPDERWTRDGYLELKPVVELNSRLITGVPRTRSRFHSAISQCIYMTMPAAARIDKRAPGCVADMEELADSLGGLMVKDPRFCLTLRAWLTHCRVEGVVVCLRHPHKVARSLMNRQQLPYGLACRFWSYHVRSLLKDLPRDRTFFFNVDEFTAGEGLPEFDRLLRFLGMTVSQNRRLQIADKVFRRNMAGTGRENEQSLPAETRALWTELKEAAAAGSEPTPDSAHSDAGQVRG